MSGYGIANHKNSYSSRVKIGNYFEDMTGLEIINNRSDIQSRDLLATDTLSVSQSQFVDPKLKIGDMPTNPEEISTKSRSGLSYDMLFGHLGDPEVNDRYATTTQETMFHNNDVKLEKMTLKEQSINEKKRARKSYQTSTEAAQQYIEEVHFEVRVPEGPLDIPHFGKKKAEY